MLAASRYVKQVREAGFVPRFVRVSQKDNRKSDDVVLAAAQEDQCAVDREVLQWSTRGRVGVLFRESDGATTAGVKHNRCTRRMMGKR